MPTFRIIHPVQIIMQYEAETAEAALTMASRYSNEHTVADFLDGALDLFVMEPRLDDE